jgi:hypothetical protein
LPADGLGGAEVGLDEQPGGFTVGGFAPQVGGRGVRHQHGQEDVGVPVDVVDDSDHGERGAGYEDCGLCVEPADAEAFRGSLAQDGDPFGSLFVELVVESSDRGAGVHCLERAGPGGEDGQLFTLRLGDVRRRGTDEWLGQRRSPEHAGCTHARDSRQPLLGVGRERRSGQFRIGGGVLDGDLGGS